MSKFDISPVVVLEQKALRYASGFISKLTCGNAKERFGAVNCFLPFPFINDWSAVGFIRRLHSFQLRMEKSLQITL